MKKFIFSAAVALAAIGGISAYNATRSTAEPLNDLALANIAALSNTESGKVCKWHKTNEKDGMGCPVYYCVEGGEGDVCECGSKW